MSLLFTLSLHFTPGPQSAVRSPQSAVRSLAFTLTEKELHDHAGFSIQVNSKNFESTERLGQHVSYNDKTFSVLVNIQYSSP